MFLSYVLSFVYVGIYWNNHHHLFQLVLAVSGGMLWANLHLLFWLSLIPFATAWMGENYFAPLPTALYGGLAADASASGLGGCMQAVILRAQGLGLAAEARRSGRDLKGKVSPMHLSRRHRALAFVQPALGGALYVAVALMWLILDRRVEHSLTASAG